MRPPSRIVLRLLVTVFTVLFLAAIFLVLQTRSLIREEILDRATAFHEEVVNVESSRLSSKVQQAALQALRLSQRNELRNFLTQPVSPETRDRASKRLQSFLENNPEFTEAVIVGLDFEVALGISLEPNQKIRGTQRKSFFSEGMDPLNAMAKIPVFIQVESSEDDGNDSYLRLVAPIFDADDLTLGILVIDLELEDLLNMLNPDPGRGHFFVVDENGVILLERPFDSGEEYTQKATDILTEDEMAGITHSRKGHVVKSQDGGYLIAHSRLDPHLAAGIDATLVQIIPLDFIFRPLNLLLGAISFTVVSILGLALCVLAILSYRMIQPIGRLSIEMLAYKPGDTPPIQSIDSERKDEIGKLFTSFGLMAKALNESFQQIQDQISALETANDELRAKRLEAEELARAKSDFLAVMSHEIRTPINAIVGFSQLLADESDEEELAHCTKRIIENSERLLFLIENILDFTRIQGGRVKIRAEDFNPALELETLRDNFRSRVDPEKVTISLSIDAQMDAFVIGDPDRIRQILSNLLENALKFTQAGEIRIRGRLTPLDEHNARMEVEVKDSGVGIPADKIASIFLPFEQADHGLRRKFEGSGLGLAICKRLTDLMGGELSVESTIESGSTFRLSLPLKISPKDQEIAELPNHQNLALATPTPLPCNFLVVEDDPNNAEFLQKFLERSEARSIHIARDKASAEKLLSIQTFDIILMDLNLGEASGLDLIHELRAGKYSSANSIKVPIVVVTALAIEEIRESCLAAGVDAFVTKPFSASALSQTLSGILKESLPVDKTNLSETESGR